MAQAVYMDQHTGTSFPAALDLPMSLARAYLESEQHREHVKGAELKARNQLALYARMDQIIKAIGNVGKAIAGRRGR